MAKTKAEEAADAALAEAAELEAAEAARVAAEEKALADEAAAQAAHAEAAAKGDHDVVMYGEGACSFNGISYVPKEGRIKVPPAAVAALRDHGYTTDKPAKADK